MKQPIEISLTTFETVERLAICHDILLFYRKISPTNLIECPLVTWAAQSCVVALLKRSKITFQIACYLFKRSQAVSYRQTRQTQNLIGKNLQSMQRRQFCN